MKKKLVIDISLYDKGIDLNEWRDKRGAWAVIVKCGGYQMDLQHYKDPCFEEHYAKAKSAGLHIGAYYYSVATTVEQAQSDASHCLSLLAGKSFDMPIYIDLEDEAQANVGPRTLTDIALTFVHAFEGAGYHGGVYTFGLWWARYGCFHTEELSDYANWLAWFVPSQPKSIADCDMWQQGGMRLSDGDIYYGDMDGYTDFSWCHVDYPSQNGETKMSWATNLDDCKDASDYAYCTCAVYSCGYSQPKRTHIGLTRLKNGTAETDCSAGVNWWLYMGGLLPNCIWFSTHTEIEYLVSMGFARLDPANTIPKRNDVLWRTGHTALYIGDGKQAEALRTERGDAGYNGSTPGDQDGGETVVNTYNASRWTWILRPPSTEEDETAQETQEACEMTMMLIHPSDTDKIYYWDGSPETVPYHVSPAEKAAIEDAYKLTHDGISLKTVKMGQKNFDAILSMTRSRKSWHESELRKALGK